MNTANSTTNQLPMQSPLKGKFQDIKQNSMEPTSLTPLVNKPALTPVSQQLKQEQEDASKKLEEKVPVQTKPQLPTNLGPVELKPIEDKQVKPAAVETGKQNTTREISPLSKVTREHFASAFRMALVVLFSGISFFGGVVAQQEIFVRESEILQDVNVSQSTDPNLPSYVYNQVFEELVDFTDWYAEPKPTTFVFRDNNNQQNTLDGYEFLAFGFRNLDDLESSTLLFDLETYILEDGWTEAPGNNVGTEATSGIKKGFFRDNSYIILNYREYVLENSIESKLIVNFN